MKFALSTFLSVAALATVQATPIASRDVFVPPILYPKAGTVWTVGQRHNVTWDISNHPTHITNSVGFILLRKGGLTTPVILEDNFSILRGRIEVTVPRVVDGTDYQLVLFGDSGNFSPNFTITGSGLDF
ncbi:hypothetical protein DFH06DRAFT_572298 [Mycena polygramma]|nr:hypothetical protein DFH06DRAFT_572298 [Mycena polygramma]